jgi:hypothetical protein
VYVLYSWMSALDYTIESMVECPDDDPNDVVFVQATTTIRGRDAIEDFVACKMFPLALDFSFRDVTIGMTPVSKVRTPLLLFPVEPVSAGDVDRVLVEVVTEVERFLGSFGPREYDALMMAKLPNGGRLNRVLEQMGWLTPRARFPAAKPLKWQGTSEKPKCRRNWLQKGQRSV